LVLVFLLYPVFQEFLVVRLVRLVQEFLVVRLVRALLVLRALLVSAVLVYLSHEEQHLQQ
jgi:hypothetical protein